jgi:hypothetical protein
MVLSLSGLSVFRHYAIFFCKIFYKYILNISFLFLAIVLHSAATVVLSAYFMSDISICIGLPYLLFFCTFLPLIIELISWIELFAFNKKL